LNPKSRGFTLSCEACAPKNRALVDSILGVAGIPPLKIDLAAQYPWVNGTRPDANGKPPQPSVPSSVSAAPIRRRSWQQIGRMLEIEAARRKGSDK
jgi:hypothetical protein